MREIASEEELLHCFRDVDRVEVELPEALRLPLRVEDTFTWTSGQRAYLLFRDRPTALPKGIVFHRNNSAIPDVAAMCEWCHAVRERGEVKLLSASVDGRRRVGLYLCADLDCVIHARELPGPNDVREGLAGDARVKKILERIGTFAARRMF
jgi:hypothetical protein